jgi:hypothetical protein
MMNKIKMQLLALLISALVFGSVAYASFPVKKEKSTEQTVSSNPESLTTGQISDAQVKASSQKLTAEQSAPNDLDDKWITLLLWFFLGVFAAHRWYKKKPVGWNILYILTLGGCGIWAIVDLINIITDNF